MQGFKEFIVESTAKKRNEVEHQVQDALFERQENYPSQWSMVDENNQLSEAIVGADPKAPNRTIVKGHSVSGKVSSISVPTHMLKGGKSVEGMEAKNEKRASVYGSEHRAPLTTAQSMRHEKQTTEEHFQKPEHQQHEDEVAAIKRLHDAGHLSISKKGREHLDKHGHLPASDNTPTLDESEKTDTARHEVDEDGRHYHPVSRKGVAGYAVYTSGHGKNEEHHIIKTCHGQTEGCGGGVHDGHVDTSKGSCFAPKAEAQYPGASVSRASTTQARHDPAMVKDMQLAHIHSIKNAFKNADKRGERLLKRNDILNQNDGETDHAIDHVNKQRAKEGKPTAVQYRYGTEFGKNTTYSNKGPKVKHGQEIPENIKRDKIRIRSTQHATDSAGNDYKDEHGKNHEPNNSYLVTDVKRDSDTDKEYQKHVKKIKYWSAGRENHELSEHEKKQGDEGHFDEHGKATTPDKAHFGHKTLNGRRYDYQMHDVLHPRMTKVDGHDIPSDARFKDNDHRKETFKTKNGKRAGAIVVTTPTKSTSGDQMQSSFTHHVSKDTIEHAKMNGGVHEIDKPEEQEQAKGKTYVAPRSVNIAGLTSKKKKVAESVNEQVRVSLKLLKSAK